MARCDIWYIQNRNREMILVDDPMQRRHTSSLTKGLFNVRDLGRQELLSDPYPNHGENSPISSSQNRWKA
jgi:hypothetical protein